MEAVLINGVKYCPCCGRKMKDTSIEDSIDAFIAASDCEDWIDCTTESVYQIYHKWCEKNEYNPATKIRFVRGITSRFTDIRSTPSNGERYFRKTW